MSKPDYALYLVTDASCVAADSLLAAVAKALAGGVTMLQLREKELASRAFYEEALAMKQLAHQYRVPLIINDRLDIALACDADGLHVGQQDLPVAAARRLLGPDKLIGASVQTVAEAIQAQHDGADSLGVGAMFATATKPDALPVSRETLRGICEAVSVPLVLIGGLNEQTLPAFKGEPVEGVAVVSAILANPDPKHAAQKLRQQVKAVLGV